MNNEQQELLNEAYENFIDKTKGLNLNLEINRDIIVVEGPVYNATPRLLIKEEFINKCKTYPEFSEKWGLKIEERELSRNERSDYYYKNGNSEGIVVGSLDRPIWEEDNVAHKWYDDNNIPTKLITITYNDKTIESYE
jgi:hypothetical protein